jgi:hypothetical protein
MFKKSVENNITCILLPGSFTAVCLSVTMLSYGCIIPGQGYIQVKSSQQYFIPKTTWKIHFVTGVSSAVWMVWRQAKMKSVLILSSYFAYITRESQ